VDRPQSHRRVCALWRLAHRLAQCRRFGANFAKCIDDAR
jgi:hypothetical protein